jgi:hypothetical protein
MQLFMEKTDRYYHLYFDMLDEGHSSMPDVTLHKMYLFLSVILCRCGMIRGQHQLLKVRTISEKLSYAYSKYCNKKHKWFGMKIYRLCDSKGYK